MTGPKRRIVPRVVAILIATTTASAIVAAPWPAAAQKKKEQQDDISLAVGETRTIPATGVKEYSAGVPGIVDATPTPDGRFFVLTGKKPGSTTLLLIRSDGTQLAYEVTVATRNAAQVEKELQQVLEGIVGLKTRRVGSRIFVEGGVSSETELKRVEQVAALYGGQVESLVTLGAVGDRKLLIRLDFFFVQYERTSGYNVGVAWPASIGGAQQGGQVFRSNFSYDFITRTTTAANASVVNQPLPRLDIAQRRGWVKIAKQSSVITANGSQATFQNGGQTNFLVQTGFAANIASVDFGTNVTVLARYDANTRDVDIKLTADVSDLTPPQIANGPPGKTTTKLDTIVTLKLGQALILSGIKTTTQRRAVVGLPGLSEIPVLGVLFASHSNDKSETEGAVFIVPSVVDTVPKSAIELINNTMSVYRDFSGDIEYVEAFPKAPPSAK